MRFRHWRTLLLLLVNLTAAYSIGAQAEPDANYQAKRQKANDLFSEGKRLEALPLLEELVKANPRDDQTLVALAACLVEHAATLTDDEAAGKERLRARDLLDKAWDLGNTSPLAMNLSQLLRQLPESGALKFSDNPQVDRVLRAGEAAFSRRDFAGALKDYAKALELDPNNYTAALFTGNTYDKQNESAKAAEWYERAIQLGPNVETAYRYYADMLARKRNMARARAMLIHAAVAEPYNRIVWRELHAWAALNDTRISEVFVGIPRVPENSLALSQQSPDFSPAWQAYRAVQANWQKGDAFKNHFPEEKEYRHSLPEESEALTAAAIVLEKLREDKNAAESLTDDRNSSLLLKLYEAGLLEPYVLFSLGDAGIARDYAAYRAKNRDKLEEFMDKFVVPPAHDQALLKSKPVIHCSDNTDRADTQ
jgi:tetratricopeptide (TPR) repeat protein